MVPEKKIGRYTKCKQDEQEFHFQAASAALTHATRFDAGKSFCSCAAADADRQTSVNPANMTRDDKLCWFFHDPSPNKVKEALTWADSVNKQLTEPRGWRGVATNVTPSWAKCFELAVDNPRAIIEE